jgi:hypothetical protein
VRYYRKNAHVPIEKSIVLTVGSAASYEDKMTYRTKQSVRRDARLNDESELNILFPAFTVQKQYEEPYYIWPA